MTPLLTPKEVAAILRRPVYSIYELVKCRKILAVRDGRHYKFRAEDVEAYIQSNLLKPTQPLQNKVKITRHDSNELRDRNGK